ncbi:hypothetical protein B0H11DRAFT_825131 [Mycena galericulata]|nr:hypothetical protein B0H11DRAFT_825131 [Mycena galericulata]
MATFLLSLHMFTPYSSCLVPINLCNRCSMSLYYILFSTRIRVYSSLDLYYIMFPTCIRLYSNHSIVFSTSLPTRLSCIQIQFKPSSACLTGLP